jgi:hypothetical protein
VGTVDLTDTELAEFRRWQAEQVGGASAEGVHVTFLLDRSGSMQGIRDDVVGGFNSFVAEQKAQPGRCRLTLWQFDSQGLDRVRDGVDLEDLKPMTPEEFQPRASTPLLDSIGRTVASMEATGRADERQVLVVLTDGLENASVEFTKEQVAGLVAAKEAKGWTVAFLGANFDAYLEGGRIGMNRGATQTFLADSAGVGAAMASTSRAVSNHRAKTYAGGKTDSSSFYETGKDADADRAGRT